MVALLAAGVAVAQGVQDLARRFGAAYLAYTPGATTKADINHEAVTSVGPYMTITVVKQSARPDRKEQVGMLVDPQSKTAAVGIVVQLPETQPAVTPDTLPSSASRRCRTSSAVPSTRRCASAGRACPPA